MLFPLGLFLKFPRIPWITLCLVILNIYVHFFHGNFRNDGLIIDAFSKNDAYINTQAKFYTEYCYDQNYSNKVCENVKLILSVAHKKNSNLDNLNTKFLLEPEFLEAANLIAEIKGLIEDDIYHEDFKRLNSFRDFIVFHEEFIELNQTRSERYSLLTKDSFNIKTIFLAMFRHANFMHLLGNMLILFVFGVYVEFRMQWWSYLGMYTIGGLFGLGMHTLFHLPQGIPILGASANVFAIMGAFYVFFIRFKFRVFVFYLYYKVINVPIKWWFFIFFFLLEFLNMFSKSNVAHEAHVYGMLVGVFFSLAYKAKLPIAPQFLYPLEEDKVKEIKNTDTLNIKLIRAKNLLELNPYNDQLRSYIFNEIFEEATQDKGVLIEKSTFLESELPYYLRNHFERNDARTVVNILNNMPNLINFHVLLKMFKFKDLVSLVDSAIADKHLYTSIRIISVIFSEYKSHNQLKNFERTMESIMEHFSLDLDQSIYLLKYSTNKGFDYFIKQYIDHGELHGQS